MNLHENMPMKLEDYRGAYSPLYKQDVLIHKIDYDVRGVAIIRAYVEVYGIINTISFREFELKNYSK
jgi:hypothetical protein